jgi:hypothetical protein
MLYGFDQSDCDIARPFIEVQYHAPAIGSAPDETSRHHNLTSFPGRCARRPQRTRPCGAAGRGRRSTDDTLDIDHPVPARVGVREASAYLFAVDGAVDDHVADMDALGAIFLRYRLGEGT